MLLKCVCLSFKNSYHIFFTYFPHIFTFHTQAMQSAGIDGEQVIFLLEDHQLLEPEFLEFMNSVLCSGDVPGLYSGEELDPLLVSLKDQASQDGFRGSMYAYFAQRVLCNLHVVLIMDCSSTNFVSNCEANPALYKCCSFQWLAGWTKNSMLKSKCCFV